MKAWFCSRQRLLFDRHSTPNPGCPAGCPAGHTARAVPRAGHGTAPWWQRQRRQQRRGRAQVQAGWRHGATCRHQRVFGVRPPRGGGAADVWVGMMALPRGGGGARAACSTRSALRACACRRPLNSYFVLVSIHYGSMYREQKIIVCCSHTGRTPLFPPHPRCARCRRRWSSPRPPARPVFSRPCAISNMGACASKEGLQETASKLQAAAVSGWGDLSELATAYNPLEAKGDPNRRQGVLACQPARFASRARAGPAAASPPPVRHTALAPSAPAPLPEPCVAFTRELVAPDHTQGRSSSNGQQPTGRAGRGRPPSRHCRPPALPPRPHLLLAGAA